MTDVTTCVLVVTLVFTVLAMMGTPLAFTLLASGAVGLLMYDGYERTDFALGSLPYDATASYSLVLIPIYILVGMLVSHSGLATQVYAVASHMLRRLPGGLGVATVAACAGIGSVMGSSVATSATIGRVAISEMRAYGYPATLASGIVAAGGSLGALIPPSVAMVLYAMLSGESVGALLLAGVVPGIVLATIYSTYIMIISARRSRVETAMPAGDATLESAWGAEVADRGGRGLAATIADAATATMVRKAERAQKRRIPYESLLYVGLIFLIVIGGLYSGFFTVTEAGAMSVLVSLVVTIILARQQNRSISRILRDSLAETTSATSMIFMLLVGGLTLGLFFVVTRLPYSISEWAVSLDVPPLLLVILLLAILLPLGTAMEELSLMLILIPIFHPVVVDLGFDGVWFAILFLRMIQIAMISPPVGISCFVVAGIAEDLTVEQVFRGAFPFMCLDILSVAIFIAFPDLITWLPNLASV